MSDRDQTSREAWHAYCDALRDAGDHILPQHPDASDETHAEALQYLLGLVKGGVGQALELADPDRPRFFRNPDSTSRWGAENADNQYLWARIRPDAQYRIYGERGTSFDFLIEVKEGYMQLGDARNFATLSADAIDCEPDGRFEIGLSAEPRSGNWLPLHPDARYVLIRQYLCDWQHERPARFAIERQPGQRVTTAVSPEQMTARLGAAGRWTRQTARFWSEWTDRLRDGWQPGRIARAAKVPGGADDIYYGNDYYRVDPGEAWILETDLPDARYWQFQLCDLWFRSADWSERQTSINLTQAHIDTDGRFRCVIAGDDPGTPNWLDTGGHPEGLLQYRWIWSRNNPRPTVHSVAISEVRSHLPADTPIVTPNARQQSITERRRHRALRETN